MAEKRSPVRASKALRAEPRSPMNLFSSEYRLEHDPRFLRRIEQARNSLRAGRGTRLEDLESD